MLAILMPVLGLTPAEGSFGITGDERRYTVDTGAGLVFQVDRANGDIRSIVYNGVEYQSDSKPSHLISGLGPTGTSVTSTTYGTNAVKITITTDDSNGVVANLTHYLMARNGENTIHMATHAVDEPGVGELRWITRLQAAKLWNGPEPSDTRGNTGPIESSDVFGMADGTTRSKYFGDSLTHGRDRALGLTYCGATGPGIGLWMVYNQPRESASGGPFFRDIQNQCGSDQEIYNYMNSGHNQTESHRLNVLHGPYALVFTKGEPPTLPLDYSWIETGGLNLLGWVPASGRGVVQGTVTGIPVGLQGVVGFANATAQYAAIIEPDGTYQTPLMKPGSYMVTLYQGELEVNTAPVRVTAGRTNTLALTSAFSTPAHLFKLGEWDGTPAGFLNAERMIQMHPSDMRMSSWGPVNHVIGTDLTSDFPAIQMRNANSPTTVTFNLTVGQAEASHVLRIGLTCAYIGGRPRINVNSGAWISGNPSPSNQPRSRSFTLGTYRGNNALFTYTIPASALVAGQNSLTIDPISGSSDPGTWLSAGWVYDCVQLDGTPAGAPTVPALLRATPGNAQITLDWEQSPSATSYNLKRSLNSSGPYTTIGSGIGFHGYTDSTVTNGVPYYYVLSAVNSAGQSGDSGEASATPAALPPAQWSEVAPGMFDGLGQFTTADPVGAAAAQQYQVVETP